MGLWRALPPLRPRLRGAQLFVALFRTVGPKRTRLISQIVAAIVGAGFIIGIQAVSPLSDYGSLSRFTLLQSPEVIAFAPDVTSWLWLPARAAMGDMENLACAHGRWPSVRACLLAVHRSSCRAVSAIS